MNLTRFVTVTLLLFVSLAVMLGSAEAAEKASTSLLRLPLSFEVNRGQTDSSVKFLARGEGYALFLTDDSAVFNFGAPGKESSAVVRMKLFGAQPASIAPHQPLPGKVNYFIGNDRSKWQSGLATYGRVEYTQVYPGIDLAYYGNQRQLEYDFVVAPGADPRQIALEFSGAKPQLNANGDLQLALEGKPITFRKPLVYQTIDGARKTVAGEYKLSGDRVQFAIAPYDHTQPLVIDPVLVYLTYLGGAGGNTAIGYAQSLGNPENPSQGVAVDSAGNLYVTGYTTSVAFPVQNALTNPVNSTSLSTDPHPSNSAEVAFVTEINPAGSALVYSTYLGGSVRDLASAIAVDGNGSAYVTGIAYSNDFPVTAGAYQTLCGVTPTPTSPSVGVCGSTGSAFLTKLAPGGGSLVYSTFLGGGNDTANSVAVDSKGQAYIAGSSYDGCGGGNGPLLYYCFPATANALLPQSLYYAPVNNPGAAFVAVFDTNGANLLYSTLFTDKSPATNPNISNSNTVGTGVAVDSTGNFYLTGVTHDENLPVTAGAFQTTGTSFQSNGGIVYRGFVAKFGPVTGAGTGAAQIYGTYLGGTSTIEPDNGQELVSGIAADASGNAYITGATQSYDFPTTPGANNTNVCWTPTTPGSCQNIAFLSKLNPPGTGLVWSTLVGGPPSTGNNGTANLIAPPRLDAKGYVYVTGHSPGGGSGAYPVVNPITGYVTSSFNGVFVTKYDPTGSTIDFSTIIQSPVNSNMFPGGMDVDAQGNIYVGGYTAAPDLPTTAGAFQTVDVTTGTTGFLAKINPFENAAVQLGISPTSANAGDPVTFTATLTGVSGSPLPTGTVNFVNGSTTLGSGTVNTSGVATFTSSTLAPGAYSVTASYVGDGVYAPANSTPPLALTINGTAAPVTINSSPAGLGFTLSGTGCGTGGTTPATLQWTSGSACTVSFSSPQAGAPGTQYVFSAWADGPTNNPRIFTATSAAATYTANFTTQYQLTTSSNPTAGGSVTGAGWYNAGVVASVAATTNSGYQFTNWSGPVGSASSASTTVTMNAPASVTANFTSAPTTTTAASTTTSYSLSAQTVTLNATVTGSPAVNGGAVTFTVTGIGTVTSSTVTNGTASATLSIPAAQAAGSYAIAASYSGAGGYSPSSDGTHSLTISPASTTTTAQSASVTYSASAQTVPLNAAVTSPAGAVNTGTVTFTVPGVGTAAPAGVNGGNASAVLTIPAGTAPGSYTIQAVFSGTANLNSSSDSSKSLSISGLAPTTTISAAASAHYSYSAQSISLNAEVQTGGLPTVNGGTVTYTVGNLGTVTSGPVVNGMAPATFTLPAGQAAGSYTITAAYSGSNTYGPSSGSGTLFIFNASTTTTAQAATVNYSASAQTVTLKATVTSPVGPVNAGTVQFTVAGIVPPVMSGTVVNGNASAVLTIPAGMAAGTYSIQALYEGTVSLGVSSDNSKSLTIVSVPQIVITWPTPAPITYGTRLSSAQLNATANVPGTFLYTPPIGTVLTAGTHNLTVIFTSTNLAMYASKSVQIVVNKANTTASILGVACYGTLCGASVHVSSSQSNPFGSPTGTVTLRATTGETCTANVVGGYGTCLLNFHSTTPTSVTGTYSGDSNFNPSTSMPITISPGGGFWGG